MFTSRGGGAVFTGREGGVCLLVEGEGLFVY